MPVSCSAQMVLHQDFLRSPSVGPRLFRRLITLPGRDHLMRTVCLWIWVVILWCPRAFRAARTGSRHTPHRRWRILTHRSVSSYTTHGFWNLSGRRSRPGYCYVDRHIGFITWIRRMLSRPLSIYNAMPG